MGGRAHGVRPRAAIHRDMSLSPRSGTRSSRTLQVRIRSMRKWRKSVRSSHQAAIAGGVRATLEPVERDQDGVRDARDVSLAARPSPGVSDICNMSSG